MPKLCFFKFWLLLSTSAIANPVVYQTRSAFDTAAPELDVQQFDDEFATASSVQFPGFTVAEDSIAERLSSRTDYFSSSDRALGFTWNGSQSLTFEFDSPVNAFAADILDFGTCCEATAFFVTNETNDWTLAAATGPGQSPYLERGNTQFFGITNDTPFGKLIFTSQEISTNDLIVFDDVSFRTVPEPMGIALMVTGLLLICRWSRSGGESHGRARSACL